MSERAAPITTLHIPDLLASLRDSSAHLLDLIRADEALSRETWRGMTIANAGSTLIRPKTAHQLYAKGLVFAEEGDEVISVPLLKFYNHGQGQKNTAQTRALGGREDVRVVLYEKLDGTMIQLFARDGEVFLTTRGRITPTAGEPMLPFIKEARALLETHHPRLLDPEAVGEHTLVFELLHPRNRIVTDHGDRFDLTLLAAFRPWRYLPAAALTALASDLGVPVARQLAAPRPVAEAEAGIAEALLALEADAHLAPEGFVVSYETDDEVLHRTKAKTSAYYMLRGITQQLGPERFARFMVTREDLHTWDAFMEFMQHFHARNLISRLTPAREASYRAHFDAFLPWYAQVQTAFQQAHALRDDWYAAHPPEDTPDYHRAFAIHHKTHHPEVFPFLIRLHKRGALTFDEVFEGSLRHLLS